MRHALRPLPVEREDLEALVIVRRLVLDVDRFDLVSVMKVRDGEGLCRPFWPLSDRRGGSSPSRG